ncbi:MAG: tRNA (adenosine(37)-N6)-threonylcarbamoyltransferase complex ATPase subunit type 1 TsaE [Lentisphaerota bacterium]
MNQISKTISKSVGDTHRAAAELVSRLGPGSVIALHGDLGAGKTCFVQGMARALGVTGAVSSPTFTLVNEHTGRLVLYHIDLYRIGSAEEALAMGLDEYIYGKGITAIEWAERVESLLTKATIHVRLEAGAGEDERVITFSKKGTP